MKKLLSLSIQKFAEFNANIEDLIKRVTKDDTIDWSKANETLNADILKYNSKNKPDMEKLKSQAFTEAQNDFIKELKIDGVDSVDTFKQHLSKLGSEDKAQEVIRLGKLNTELQGKFDILEGNFTKVTQESAVYKNEKFLADKKPNVDVDYLTFKIGKFEGETFEDKYNTFMADESSKQYFTPVDPRVKTTNKAHVVKQTGDVSGVRQILIDQGKITEK